MNTITIVGNLGGDPELRFTSQGKAVATFNVADTPRRKNAAGEWVDGETLWMRVTLWDKAAESAVESLAKGDRVIAVGRLESRSWEKDGQTRTSVEMVAEQVGKVAKIDTRRAADPWSSPAPF